MGVGESSYGTDKIVNLCCVPEVPNKNKPILQTCGATKANLKCIYKINTTNVTQAQWKLKTKD